MYLVAVNVLEVQQFQTGRFNTGAAAIASSGLSIGVKRVTPYGVMCAILGSLQAEQMGKLPEMGGAINKDTVT